MKKVITLMVLTAFASTILIQDVVAAGPQNDGPASAGATYALAVLELEGSGSVSSSETRRLSERLRSEFGGAGIFEVISASQLETAMQAAGLSMTGCSTRECALQAGRAAASKLVTFGTIDRAGALYEIQVQMLHVKSGQTVQSVRESFDGDFEALEAHMASVARKLMGPSAASAASSGRISGQESTSQTVTESPSAWESSSSESYSEDSNSGGKALIIGLAAVGLVGGGLLISQALKNDDGGSTPTTPPPPPGGTLPNPPTFP